jgi:C-terminal processing protease CtpA/Prc
MKTLNKISKVVVLALSFTGIASIPSYADVGNAEAVNSASDDLRNIIGVEISTATDVQKAAVGCAEGGVYISAVIPKQPAETAGLRPGDVIVKIDGNPVKEHWEALTAMADLDAGREYPFEVCRRDARGIPHRDVFKVLVKKVQEKAIGKIS